MGKQVIEIFTDGACSGNPGPGGWGAILKYGGHAKEMSGGDPWTTNNRMELTAFLTGFLFAVCHPLMAAIEALEALKQSSAVILYTDSVYLRDGITKWIDGWKANGWQTANKKPVKNVDLWRRLLTISKRHQIEWLWVKGHAGHPENERADALARHGIEDAR